MDLKCLLLEAQHSHRIYLELLNFVHEKSIGLKWGDVAQSAISVIVDNADHTQLRSDLVWMIVKPIEILHQSVIELVYAKTNSIAAKATDNSNKAIKMAPADPIGAKNLLIKSINDLFKTLETLNNSPYPQIEVYHGHNIV